MGLKTFKGKRTESIHHCEKIFQKMNMSQLCTAALIRFYSKALSFSTLYFLHDVVSCNSSDPSQSKQYVSTVTVAHWATVLFSLGPNPESTSGKMGESFVKLCLKVCFCELTFKVCFHCFCWLLCQENRFCLYMEFKPFLGCSVLKLNNREAIR